MILKIRYSCKELRAKKNCNQLLPSTKLGDFLYKINYDRKIVLITMLFTGINYQHRLAQSVIQNLLSRTRCCNLSSCGDLPLLLCRQYSTYRLTDLQNYSQKT